MNENKEVNGKELVEKQEEFREKVELAKKLIHKNEVIHKINGQELARRDIDYYYDHKKDTVLDEVTRTIRYPEKPLQWASCSCGKEFEKRKNVIEHLNETEGKKQF